MSDIFLCYVVPCFIVVVLNALIFSKVMSAKKSFLGTQPSQSYLNLSSQSTVSQRTKPTTPIINSCIVSKESNKRAKRVVIPTSTQINLNNVNNNTNNNSSSTRILLVLPVVYILLNTPFYLIRLADTIALNMFNSTEFSIQGGLNNKQIRWLNNGAHYLYYGNFACDVVVYAFSSSTFRRSVCHVWCQLLCPKWSGMRDKFESTGIRSCKSANKNKIPTTSSTTVRLLEKCSTPDTLPINSNNPCENSLMNIYYKHDHKNSVNSF